MEWAGEKGERGTDRVCCSENVALPNWFGEGPGNQVPSRGRDRQRRLRLSAHRVDRSWGRGGSSGPSRPTCRQV